MGERNKDPLRKKLTSLLIIILLFVVNKVISNELHLFMIRVSYCHMLKVNVIKIRSIDYF